MNLYIDVYLLQVCNADVIRIHLHRSAQWNQLLIQYDITPQEQVHWIDLINKYPVNISKIQNNDDYRYCNIHSDDVAVSKINGMVKMIEVLQQENGTKKKEKMLNETQGTSEFIIANGSTELVSDSGGSEIRKFDDEKILCQDVAYESKETIWYPQNISDLDKCVQLEIRYEPEVEVTHPVSVLSPEITSPNKLYINK